MHFKLMKKGFTLIEMIIVVSISAVLIALIISAYVTGSNLFQQEASRADIWQEGNHSLEIMSKEIMKSRQITSAESARITLWPEDLNTNNTIEANEIIAYYRQSGNLIRASSTDTMILTGHATSLNFTYNQPANPSLVFISLTLSDGQRLSTFETRARLRNY